MPLEDNLTNSRSSLYFAYTDLSCFDYRSLVSSVPSKNAHLIIMNNYRINCPFSVYLSVLKSSGARCYDDDDRRSSCATRMLTYSYIRLLFPLAFLSLIIFLLFVLISRRKCRISDENIRRIFGENFSNVRRVYLQSLNHILSKTDVSDGKITRESSQQSQDVRAR